MTKVAIKDSKAKILESFQQILADRQRLDLRVATREEEVERERNKQILEVASQYTVDSIVKGLADLQLEFGSVITSLALKITTETSKLDELKQGIATEAQHLQELQRIRVVADALHLLTQEHQEKLRVLEQTATQERETLEKQMTEARRHWQQEQEEHDILIHEQSELLTEERQRQEEDYQYEIEQTRKIETDDYEELRKRIERELQEATQEKEKQWAERDRILTMNQPLLQEYQQKAATFTTELEEAIKKAREEGIREVNQDAKVKADLLEKEWEASQQSYELKIQSLEAKIQKQAEQVTELAAQLQAAMQQAQGLAMQAFQSSANKLAGQ